MKHICVIGTGYVGLITGTCFAEWGNTVVCLDVDERKVIRLQRGEMPIFEPTLQERVQRNVEAGRLRFSSSYADALANAEFAFIAVPTPTDDSHGGADLRYVESAARSIADHLDHDLIVVNKSTVPVGTGKLVARIFAEHRIRNCRYAVVSNPEFLREGSAFADCMQPDRIVLGSDEQWAAESVAALYGHLGCPLVLTDLATAEMIKYASNAMLATRISFMNEVAAICERVGADAKGVAAGMGQDRRIGTAFLDPGLGYGGSCFPKDVKALIHMGVANGYQPKLLDAVHDVNEEVRFRAVQKLEDIFDSISGITVALWGVAFKPHTDDLREAPAIDIARALMARGTRVRAYDPEAMAGAADILPAVEFLENPYDAARGADAVILVTEWPEFSAMNFAQVKQAMRCPVMIDGRNALEADELTSLGFIYRGMGRRSAPTGIAKVFAVEAAREPVPADRYQVITYHVPVELGEELEASLEAA